ncbi:GDSL esterase/lipase EXL3-like isoform X1 [Tasmannia lanceolata]|uniref:GDSL esterase/lipase EXL3-like isoform X1 n=1 Tax=Tasmannia lanceolata TaxID=3420 RepID=UPI004062B6DF
MQFFSPLSYSFSILSLLLHILRAQALLKPNRSSVPAFIVFGDSIVDPGNNNNLETIVKCNFPPYGIDLAQHKPTGRFCNGKIPSDMIASALGLKDKLPAYLDPQLTPNDLLTGVSFASGGSGYDPLTSQLVSVLSLHDQLEMLKEYIGKLKAIVGQKGAANIVSNSVYIAVIGTDDLANTYFSTPFRRASYDVNAYTDLMVQSASTFYQELYRLGARKVGVTGLPPVGCVPSQRTLAGGILRNCQPSYNQAAMEFNSKLSKELEALTNQLPGSKFIYIDIYTILSNLIFHPSNYGFEVSTKGCCGTGDLEVSILCNPSTPICTDVTNYVFWDSYHPTEKAYKVISDNLIKNYLPLIV